MKAVIACCAAGQNRAPNSDEANSFSKKETLAPPKPRTKLFRIQLQPAIVNVADGLRLGSRRLFVTFL